jgi:hypothetical protein
MAAARLPAEVAMRIAVETWSPDYGTPVGDEALDPSTSAVDESLEVPIDHWRPLAPEPGTEPIDDLLFVDGVRRVEAHVWIEDEHGVDRQGICASYAAGAVHCNGVARLVDARVERVLLAPPPGAPLVTRHGTFSYVEAGTDDPGRLPLLLQERMGALEATVVRDGPAHDLVVVDGPLKRGHVEPGIVGYVKTHRQAYGQQIVRDTLTALAVGERTPVLLIEGDDRIGSRFTWYQRLPGPVRHGWAGIVRLEAAASAPVADVIVLADRLCASLGRFASTEPKDPRAPQNLYPVGGLERELRRRLGDPMLLYRALRRAQTAA